MSRFIELKNITKPTTKTGLVHVSSIKHCLTKAEQVKEQAVTLQTKMKAHKLYPTMLQILLIFFGGQRHLLRHQI